MTEVQKRLQGFPSVSKRKLVGYLFVFAAALAFGLSGATQVAEGYAHTGSSVGQVADWVLLWGHRPRFFHEWVAGGMLAGNEMDFKHTVVTRGADSVSVEILDNDDGVQDCAVLHAAYSEQVVYEGQSVELPIAGY